MSNNSNYSNKSKYSNNYYYINKSNNNSNIVLLTDIPFIIHLAHLVGEGVEWAYW